MCFFSLSTAAPQPATMDAEPSKRQRVGDQMEVEEPAAARPSGNLQQGYTKDELNELLRLCAAEPAPQRPPPS